MPGLCPLSSVLVISGLSLGLLPLTRVSWPGPPAPQLCLLSLTSFRGMGAGSGESCETSPAHCEPAQGHKTCLSGAGEIAQCVTTWSGKLETPRAVSHIHSVRRDREGRLHLTLKGQLVWSTPHTERPCLGTKWEERPDSHKSCSLTLTGVLWCACPLQILIY